MKETMQQGFKEKQKAVDLAVWLEFQYRREKKKLEVWQDKKSGLYYAVFKTGKGKSGVPIPADYAAMDYEQIKAIRCDGDPFYHWEELAGTLATIHGEVLRFILQKKIPLEKWIRYELASRGYDENHLWVGFEKAKEIWLQSDNPTKQNG